MTHFKKVVMGRWDKLKERIQKGLTQQEISLVEHVLGQICNTRWRVTRQLRDLGAIKEAIQQNPTLKEAANKLGVSCEFVARIHREEGWNFPHIHKGPRGKTSRHKNNPKVQQMVEMHKNNATLREIGKKFNMTAEGVRQTLNILGIETCRRDKADICQMIKLAEEGKNNREIGAIVGVHPATVAAKLKSEWIGHIERPKKKKYRGKVDLEKAKELYDSGLSFKQVAAIVGVSWNTLRHAFQRHGISMRTPEEGIRLRKERDNDNA